MADVYKQSFKQNYTHNIELSIFNCGLERCAPGQTWSRHPGPLPHPSGRLGQGRVRGRRAHLRGRAGRSVLCPPQPAHPLYCDEAQPWEYSWVGFNGACAHKLTAQLPFTDAAPVHHTQDLEGMRAALSSIYSSRGLQPQDEAAWWAISTSSSPP